MKKFLSITAAVAMLLSTAACSIREPNMSEITTTVPESSEVQTTETSTEATTAAPVENTLEYWQSRYPDAEICKFKIKMVRYDEVQEEKVYYYINQRPLIVWVNSEFNVDGWFALSENAIYSSDGNYKITGGGVLSGDISFKAKYIGTGVAKEHISGDIHTLDSNSTFRLYGLRIQGDQHESDDNGVYGMFDIDHEFYLDENMTFCLDAMYDSESSTQAEIYCVPHMEDDQIKAITDFETLKSTCVFRCTNILLDSDVSCQGSIPSANYKEGKYDILFVYNNTIPYYVTIDLEENSETINEYYY